ncbi:MAG: hypothetical protein KQH57_17305 [Actinomycetales bacterium]|nr:hypothetical protein [Actinomycetales bacterium]
MTTQTTTSVHRPGCQRPGWTVEHSRAVHGIAIARCLGCGAVELRKTEQEETR